MSPRKANLLSWFRGRLSPGERDVFARTRLHLTLRYTAMLTVFLLLFNVIVFALFLFIIRSQERNDVERLADQEVAVIRDAYVQNRKVQNLKMDSRAIISLGSDQFFFYLIAPDGTLLVGAETFASLRNVLLEKVQGWDAANQAIRYDTLKLDGSIPKFERKALLRASSSGAVDLIMTARPVTIGKHMVGTLYVGKNITSHANLFRMLIFVLAGLTLVFAGAAFGIGRLMSRRAMVPIEQAYARQRQFVADASHELRTPLTVMRSSLDALGMEEATARDPFSARLLAGMKDEVRRMTRLVGDLLTIARSDSGVPELKREWFDFRDQGRQALEAMQPAAAAKGIRVSLSATDPLPVYGDQEKLRQLLYILLDNAIKYTPEGGAVLVQAAVDGTERSRVFTLAVSDSGPGVAPEDAQRIFERFYRVDRARSRNDGEGGHGLGLAIAKWIVQAHHGTIGVAPAASAGGAAVAGDAATARGGAELARAGDAAGAAAAGATGMAGAAPGRAAPPEARGSRFEVKLPQPPIRPHLPGDDS